jgi:hypothetical protein
MSANELALALRVPATRVNDIANETRHHGGRRPSFVTLLLHYAQVLDEHAGRVRNLDGELFAECAESGFQLVEPGDVTEIELPAP